MTAVKTQSPLSTMVQRMAESETLKMAQMARNLKAQGHDVISLSLGEPDFDTPDHIKMAAIKALTEGFTKYTPVAGIPDLLDAICKKLKRDNNLDFVPNQIVVSTGAKQSIYNVAFSLLEKGDECIILAPYWVSYAEIIKMTARLLNKVRLTFFCMIRSAKPSTIAVLPTPGSPIKIGLFFLRRLKI
jgi:aspartate aminotransferase